MKEKSKESERSQMNWPERNCQRAALSVLSFEENKKCVYMWPLLCLRCHICKLTTKIARLCFHSPCLKAVAKERPSSKLLMKGLNWFEKNILKCKIRVCFLAVNPRLMYIRIWKPSREIWAWKRFGKYSGQKQDHAIDGNLRSWWISRLRRELSGAH
jgi:hypothetical protein